MGAEEQQPVAPQGAGQAGGHKGGHAPWMSQQQKKGAGAASRKADKRALKAKKHHKKEQQWLQQLQQRQQQQDQTQLESKERAFDDGDPPPAGRVKSAASFTPSAALQLLLKRPEVLRRRRGVVVSDMIRDLRRLQCPFSWGLAPLTASGPGLYALLDSTPHRPTAWHVAVDTIHIACEFARRGVMWKSRELLEDVYALLAEDDDDVDGLLRRYRAGLKHVLDACWLLVRDDADAKLGRRLPDGRPSAGVVLYEELGDAQRASVFAMKSIMARGDMAAARCAVELDPSEGQWLYLQGNSMRAARARKQGVRLGDDAWDRRLRPEYTPEERAVYLQAYAKRKNPQTVVRLARCYVGSGADDRKRCHQLIREAQERFPLSAYVYLRSARLFDQLDRGEKDARRAFICFQRALHLGRAQGIGGWMRARLDYGSYLLENGFALEGAYHFSHACCFFQDME